MSREKPTKEFPWREIFKIYILHLGKATEAKLPKFVDDTKHGVAARELVSKIKILKYFACYFIFLIRFHIWVKSYELGEVVGGGGIEKKWKKDSEVFLWAGILQK